MFQILAKAQELEKNGKEIIHFEIGDPDFDTPKNIIDAAIESLNREILTMLNLQEKII